MQALFPHPPQNLPMTYSLDQIPFFAQLKDSQNILLAGAGGGFDIYCGIPLYFPLQAMGKKVVLGNLSFTPLQQTTAKLDYPNCYRIEGNERDLTLRGYFPEMYLKRWLAMQGELPPLYAFSRVGARPLRDVYKHLAKKHEIDTVVLVDGGTDSLMFGDEAGLGTPQEDVCSMIAAYRSGVKRQFLVSIGFGVDHYHGVSHYRFLENIAHLANEGGYLGLFHYHREMPEVKQYFEAVDYANAMMQGMESIVSNSILSAIEGEYGNIHRTSRTAGSELWINPLMSIAWCFDLRAVVRQLKYYEHVKDTVTMSEFNGRLADYRSGLQSYRERKIMPH
jgi:hypothetical protein